MLLKSMIDRGILIKMVGINKAVEKSRFCCYLDYRKMWVKIRPKHSRTSFVTWTNFSVSISFLKVYNLKNNRAISGRTYKKVFKESFL